MSLDPGRRRNLVPSAREAYHYKIMGSPQGYHIVGDILHGRVQDSLLPLFCLDEEY